MEGISYLDIAIIIVYYMGILFLGYMMGKRVKKKGLAEFATGSKSQGMFVLICSVAASHVGSGLCLGLVGKMYVEGFQAIWIALGYFTGTILYTVVMAKRIRQRAEKPGWGTTMGDVFEDSYGRGGRAIFGVVATWERLGVAAGQLVAIGVLLSIMFEPFGLSNVVVCTIIAGIVIAIYVSMGGLTAVIYSDTIQCIVMVAGIGIALPILLLNGVPEGMLFNSSPVEGFYSLKPTDMMILTTALSWGTSALANQTIWARIVAAKDVKTAYKANIIGSGIGIAWGFVMAIIAFSMVSLYPTITGTADTFLLKVIVDTFPIGITGLILAAVLANVVTTADSVILSGVLNLSHDLYRKTFKRDATDEQVLKFSRFATPCAVIIPIVLGACMPLIIEVQNLGYAVYGAGVAVPFWFALLSKKPLSHKAGIAAIAVGFVVSGYFYLNPINFPNSVIGMAACFVTFVIINALDKNKGKTVTHLEENAG